MGPAARQQQLPLGPALDGAIGGLPPGKVCRPAARHLQGRNRQRRLPNRDRPAQPEEGRRQHQPVQLLAERQVAPFRIAHPPGQQMPAHAVPQGQPASPRRGRIEVRPGQGLQRPARQPVQIGQPCVEAVDMPCPIVGKPGRSPLPPPVEARDGKSSRPQAGDRVGPFLVEIGPPGQQQQVRNRPLVHQQQGPDRGAVRHRLAPDDGSVGQVEPRRRHQAPTTPPATSASISSGPIRSSARISRPCSPTIGGGRR